MLNRPFAAVAMAAFALSPLMAAEPAVATHKDIPSTLKEAKALGIPAFVVMNKAKATQPVAAADPRIARKAKAFASASITLNAALAKQYGLEGDAFILLMDADGTVLETFPHDAAAKQVLAAMNKHVDAARGELLKMAKPGADAKAQRAALTGLMRLGPFAEDLVQLLVSAEVKDAARKALVALPPEAAIGPVLDGLKSEDAALRAAVYPIAVQMTGYKHSTLKVWQSGTSEERTAAWDKWNEAVEAQFPRLNRAVLAFCESNLGVQVNDGECAMLVMDAYAECKAQPKVDRGATYVWGRQIKPGEPVLPGDIVQFEGAKFGNGWTFPHHTAVVQKVIGPKQFEVLQQNVAGVKRVQVGKLDVGLLKEGTVVFYRPQAKE